MDMERSHKEIYTLSTGTVISANRGFIGLSRVNDYSKISTGYDNQMCTDYNGVYFELTKEEQLEIAEFMINEWQEYANELK